MRIVSTSYNKSKEFKSPDEWLKRICFYTGILDELAKEHDVISIERINYEGTYRKNGVGYYFIYLKRSVVRFPFRMHRLIKEFCPDVVFVNGFIFPLQILQLKWKLGRDVKIIVLHRAERPFKGIKKYLQKMADKCVSHYLFTSSEFGDEWLQEGIISDRNKIREIIQASSVFVPACRDSARSTTSVSGAPVFLWVGRLDENKDPVTIVKGFIEFLSWQPSAMLYMIYQSGELLNELDDLVQKSGKAKQAIRLIGQVPHNKMANWYNSADFILSGSHYEGSGVAVSEAMSCGCIPVVTNIPSFRRMTGPGRCGLLFKPGSAESLLHVLLITREMNIEEERNKTISQFQQELSFEAIAGKINRLIGELKDVDP